MGNDNSMLRRAIAAACMAALVIAAGCASRETETDHTPLPDQTGMVETQAAEPTEPVVLKEDAPLRYVVKKIGRAHV